VLKRKSAIQKSVINTLDAASARVRKSHHAMSALQAVNRLSDNRVIPPIRNQTTMPIIAPQLAEVAQLVADPGRAKMLSLLMDGRARMAGELAGIAGVTPQTASAHLAKLVQRALLTVEKRGARRFYRLAGPLVAQMLEGITTVAVTGPQRFRPPSKMDEEMRRASICYDHLTGKLGVAITDALEARGYLVLDRDGGELTETGYEFLSGLGLNVTRNAHGQMFCRLCLDWSEKRPHLSGRIGAEMADLAFRRDWIRRRPDVRSVEITPAGLTAFRTLIGADI
jgi:DNA-binding transcriptional ArsR family regulator